MKNPKITPKQASAIKAVLRAHGYLKKAAKRKAKKNPGKLSAAARKRIRARVRKSYETALRSTRRKDKTLNRRSGLPAVDASYSKAMARWLKDADLLRKSGSALRGRLHARRATKGRGRWTKINPYASHPALVEGGQGRGGADLRFKSLRAIRLALRKGVRKLKSIKRRR